MNTYRIYNIEWGTDGERVDFLPVEITVNVKSDKDIEDRLSDFLSDTFGFCHNGFDFEYLGNN